MRNVVIIDVCHATTGSFGGNLRPLEVDTLVRAVIITALECTGLEPGQVDEIFLGYCRQSSDCSDTARHAALLAGIPEVVPTGTVICACVSGMLVVDRGSNAMRTGRDQVVLAGGTESMSNATFYLSDTRWGVGTGTIQLKDSLMEAQFCSQPQNVYGKFNISITAEDIAARMSIARREQDRSALTSQEKARAAITADCLKDEAMPLTVPRGRREPDRIFNTDEFPRETSLKLLSWLKPVSLPPDGTMTTGNSSGRNDGASMLVLMDVQLTEKQGLKSLARALSVALTGVNPHYMRLDPVPATQKVLEMAGLRLGDMQLIELNEAFATQSIDCIQELGLQNRTGIVNVNDGVIASRRPIGSSGSRILVALIHEMGERNLRYGLATLCITSGIGVATVVETVQ